MRERFYREVRQNESHPAARCGRKNLRQRANLSPSDAPFAVFWIAL